MLTIIDGPPGSGKSAYVVSLICDYLQAGRPVWHNLPLNAHAIAARLAPKSPREQGEILLRLRYLEACEVAAIPTWYPHLDENFRVVPAAPPENEPPPRGVVWILDEAYEYWDSRGWQKRQKDGSGALLLRWISQHRKHRSDVILMSQDENDIDATLRARAVVTYTCWRSDMHKVKDPWLPIRWPIRFTVVVGTQPGLKKPVSREFCRLKWTYGLYDSYSHNAHTDKGEAVETMDEPSWRSRLLELRRNGLPLLVMLSIYAGMAAGAWQLYLTLSGYSKGTPPSVRTAPPPPHPTTPAQAPPAPPQRWHLVPGWATDSRLPHAGRVLQIGDPMPEGGVLVAISARARSATIRDEEGRLHVVPFNAAVVPAGLPEAGARR